MTTSKKSLLTIDKSMNTFKLENINLIRVLDTTWSYPLSDLEKMSVDYGLGYRGPASIYFTFYFKGKIPTSFRVGRPHLTHSKFLTLQKTQNLRNREQEIIGPEVAHFLNTKLELRYRGGSVFDARYSKYFKGIKVPE